MDIKFCRRRRHVPVALVLAALLSFSGSEQLATTVDRVTPAPSSMANNTSIAVASISSVSTALNATLATIGKAAASKTITQSGVTHNSGALHNVPAHGVPSVHIQSTHFLIYLAIFVFALIVCCYTYRKKFMGSIMGGTHRRARRANNVRYQRLATSEAAVTIEGEE